MCRRGKKHFDVQFWRISFVPFPLEDGKEASYEVRNWWKGAFFPPESAAFVFLVNIIKALFPIGTLTWRVNNYVARQGKVIKRKTESTKW